ncbi:unnamed protein product [Toxocara canis]|uniref:Uncharacterized protein n=1 Tax=Toxocara canis TaxID=6265 RepID=A0A3P7GWL6_TOXCA|nr:unnamed protein product [Toxocara canis]
MCNFIGDELCEVIEKVGNHTVNEIVDKTNFNPKLKLPDPPCLVIFCLTDLFGGEWEFDVFVEYKGNTVLRFRLPAREKYLQVSAETTEYDDDNDCDDEDDE